MLKRIDIYRIKAFSLTEMMVVMLILSIILAVSMPIITKRTKLAASGGSCLWANTTDLSKIYYGTAVDSGVAIGANNFSALDNSRLLINTANNTQAHLIFKEAGTETGKVFMDSFRNVGIGMGVVVNKTAGRCNSTAIGYYANAKGANSIAYGTNAIASNESSTAMGWYSKATGLGSTAIGPGVVVTGANSIAIGSGAYMESIEASNSVVIGNSHVYSANSVAIGSAGTPNYPFNSNGLVAIGAFANAYTANSTAVGYNSKVTGEAGCAIGANARTHAGISIGYSCSSADMYSISLGRSANASYNGIAIGSGSMAGAGTAGAPGISAVAIGYGANAYYSNSVAIGYGASSNSNNQISIGRNVDNVYIPGTLTVGTQGGNFYITGGTWVTTSDKRLKNINNENIDGLDKINKIKTYNYIFKEDQKKVPHVGVIAQDIKKVFPNSVIKGDDGYLMVRQEDMFYATINSIKQLDKIIQGLVDNVKSIFVKIQLIEDRISALINVNQINSKKIKLLEAKNKNLEMRILRLEGKYD